MRGCGHSFHIECILPDLSVCRICESTLHAIVKSLKFLVTQQTRQFWQTLESDEFSRRVRHE